MNIRIRLVSLVMTGAMLVACAAAEARSASKALPQAETTETSEDYWYDGSRRVPVWVLGNHVAEIQSAVDSESLVKAVDPDAELTAKGSGALRVYRLSPGRKSRDVIQLAASRGAESAGNARTKVSELFGDSRTEGSRLRALPGGVIVGFAVDWSPERCAEWLGSKGLSVQEKLTFAPNTYLVESPAGIETLRLANRLYETGDVRRAQPDWWMEAVPR